MQQLFNDWLKGRLGNTLFNQYFVCPPFSFKTERMRLGVLFCSFCRRSAGMLFHAFCNTIHNSSTDFGCSFFSRSTWSQMSSIMFKSWLCGGHSINFKTPCCSFRLKYCFTLFAVCFGSLSCWKSSTRRNSVANQKLWLFFCIHYPTNSHQIAHSISTYTSLYTFTVGCKHALLNTSPFRLRTC